MEEIKREGMDYKNYLLSWFYTFKSKKERGTLQELRGSGTRSESDDLGCAE